MLAHSAAGRIGRFLEPALRPLGFDWRIGTAFLGAFAAKEVFVAQMGIVFSIGDAETSHRSLRQKLHENYNRLTGFCVMLFAMIATPCVATVAVTRREAGSWKWAIFQFGGLTVMAYILTLLVHQIGLLLS
jgi:ferrous iron transport protein B